MVRLTAVLDASVLYSMAITDLLIETAHVEMFRARWTDQIHDEWERNLIRNRPDLDPAAIRRRRNAMKAAVSDAIITGYESHIGGLALPDPDDRHVLAAAIIGNADVIVTLNTKDFPSEVLGALGIEVQHPDAFLAHLLELHEPLFLECARRCRLRLKNPEIPVDSYLNNLHKAGLVTLSAELERAKSAL